MCFCLYSGKEQQRAFSSLEFFSMPQSLWWNKSTFCEHYADFLFCQKRDFFKSDLAFFCIHLIQAHAQVSIPLRKIQMPGLTWWLFPIIKNTWDATSAKWPTPWFTAVCILPFFAGIPVCNLDKAALSAPTWDLRYSIHWAQGKTWWENQEEHSTEADGVSM